MVLFREWETNVGDAMGPWADKFIMCPLYPAFNYRRYSASNRGNRARRRRYDHLELQVFVDGLVLITSAYHLPAASKPHQHHHAFSLSP